MKKLISCIAVLGMMYAAPANAEGDGVFGAKSTTLENGLQVVVIENHRAPVVTHMLWYKVGSADEPKGDGVSGAAHFLEHLMFKGTKAIGPGKFSKLIREMAGNDNAFTSWDYTAYFQSIPSKFLPQVMALEADRMINLQLDDKEIEPERDVIIEERRMRTDNDPKSLFNEQLRANLFINAPYGEPIIGWKNEMPKLSRADVENYYTTWYTPDNAILVVSGDVTFEQVVDLARKTYGIIPSHDVPDHVRPQVPDLSAPVRLTLEQEDIRQPVFIKGWVVPSIIQDPKTYATLTVMADSLSGGSATKLYQTLVVERKMATSIDLTYDGDYRGQGSLWLYVVPAPNVGKEELERAVSLLFSETVGNGISDSEVAASKTRLIDQALFARDSVTGPAMVIGQAMSMGVKLDDIEHWPEKIAAVSRADVQNAFDTYLHPVSPKTQPVTGWMLPKQQKPEEK